MIRNKRIKKSKKVKVIVTKFKFKWQHKCKKTKRKLREIKFNFRMFLNLIKNVKNLLTMFSLLFWTLKLAKKWKIRRNLKLKYGFTLVL